MAALNMYGGYYWKEPGTLFQDNAHPDDYNPDAPRVFSDLFAEHADIALLSEVVGHEYEGLPDYEWIARESGLTHVYRPAGAGTAILSRWPLSEGQELKLGGVGMARAIVTAEGRRIELIAAHWPQDPAHRPHMPSPTREAVAMALKARSYPDPAIIGGDLNAYPGRPEIQTMYQFIGEAWRDYMQNVLARPRASDDTRLPHGIERQEWADTGCGAPDQLLRRIDYVFSGRVGRVTAYRCHSMKGSDHDMHVATFER